MSGNNDRLGAAKAEATKKPDPKAEVNGTSTGVYCSGAPLYREAGWLGVIPLPPGQKHPPVKGFTGHDGAWPNEEQIARWMAEKPVDANLMLRVNYGLIGIDVDAYDSKTGAQTLAEAERRWGQLPRTYRSSARGEDVVSGIRVFKVPEGVLFRGMIKFVDLGLGDVEIVQPHHRFVVAWPSINPKVSQQYRWYDGDGSLMPDGLVPRVADVPALPQEWVDALSRDAVREAVFDESTPALGAARRERVNEEMYHRLIAQQDDGPPDIEVARRRDRAIAGLNDGTGSRYDTTRDHVLALMRLRAKGHIGVPSALDNLYKHYVDAVADTRPTSVAEREFLRFTEGAAVLIAATPTAGSEEAENEFWTQREVLAHVRAFARSRGVAPYAVLGAVLRRAIALVPPSVQLPPIVGDAASVNLYTVSVGRSGQGKDAANGVARAAIVFVDADDEVVEDPPAAVGVGSGEGLAKALRPSDDESATATHVNLEVPEISTLGALADRKGATVVGELLKAYMGQALGFTNARKDTTSFVSAHSYRMCLGVGAQPENANVFMSREGDGLPQRFLWLPTTDPHAPAPAEEHSDPVRPERVLIPTSFPVVVPGTPHHIQVPAQVRASIRWHRHQILTGVDHIDPLDGHLMLTRLKVGFGLALLDGRRQITMEDWDLAGRLVEVSNHERTKLRDLVADRRRHANVVKAIDQADRQKIIVERQVRDNSTRVWDTIQRKLLRTGPVSRRDLQRACDSTIASDFSAVFDEALDEGRLVMVGDANAALYALGPQ